MIEDGQPPRVHQDGGEAAAVVVKQAVEWRMPTLGDHHGDTAVLEHV